MHLEYVVLGPPISNQQSRVAGKANLTAWKAKLRVEVCKAWAHRPLTANLKTIIINFHADENPSLDLDNMSKPIHDVMENLIYKNDRQITQAELTHVRIDAPFNFVRAPQIIVSAIQAGIEFVYVRIEDPVEPFPLPNVGK